MEEEDFTTCHNFQLCPGLRDQALEHQNAISNVVAYYRHKAVFKTCIHYDVVSLSANSAACVPPGRPIAVGSYLGSY